MKGPTRQIFKDLKFWSLSLSVIAIVLSQLPPVKLWIADVSLDARVSDQIRMDNTVGLIDIGSQVFLTNAGNRTLRVQRFELTLQSPSGKLTTLDADSYVQPAADGMSSVTYPLGDVRLAPGETWTNYVYFSRERSPSTLEKLQDIKLQISDDILRNGMDKPRDRMLEATPDVVKPALDLFQSNFDLEKGDYYLTFRFLGPKDQVFAENRLRLPVYQFHINLLKSQTDEYRYGYGIYHPMVPLKLLTAQAFSAETKRD